jgi:hypothetical protein
MTDASPMFSFDSNPNQNSTRLRTNSDFNLAQKLTNVLLNGRNYISWAKTAMETKSDQKLEPKNKRSGI